MTSSSAQKGIGMWLENMFNNSSIATIDKLIQFTEKRQQILAHNIANIDTPGYKIRDLNLQKFQNDLRNAIENRKFKASISQKAKIDYDQYLLFHDKNNRSIEKLVTSATKNALLHNVAVELLRSQYAILGKAISLRV